MTLPAISSHSLELPGPADAEKALRDARTRFGRALQAWASDLLVLRRTSRHEPTWRIGDADQAGWSMAA